MSDGDGHSPDVAEAHRWRKMGAECLEMTDVAGISFSIIFSAENLKCMPHAHKGQQAGVEGQKETTPHQQDQQWGPPSVIHGYRENVIQ